MKKYILSLVLMFMGLITNPIHSASSIIPQDLIISAITHYEYSKGTQITIIFIHACDDEVIGKAELRDLGNGDFYLDLLKIEPEYQCKQYGQRLFKLVCMYIKQHDGHTLCWQASPYTARNPEKELPRLIKFYQSFGGEVVEWYTSSAKMRLIFKKVALK